MATDPNTLAQGAEPNDDDPNAPPIDGDPNDNNDPPEDQTPEPVKELARKGGWVDKDQYTGPPEAWKPADQFILDGREIQRETARKLTTLERSLDQISRTNAQVMESEISRRVDELTGRYQKAVDDGDPATAYKLANEIGSLTTQRPPTPAGPPPEAAEFAQRNASWFQKDPLATSLAVSVTNQLASQGYDAATQLAAAEKEVRRVYPNLFAGQVNGAKPQPGVNRPGSRGPVGNGSREKGYADMPEAARKACDQIIETGAIKATPEEAKKLYAKNYWQNAERTA